MKKVFSAPVQIWQVVVVVVLVAALTGTVVAASAASFPSALLTQGVVRMAVASSTTQVAVPATYTSTNVLQQTITIPVGKVGDIAVTGEVDIEDGAGSGYQYCFGQYRLDNVATGTQFNPGNYILEGFNPPENNLSVPIDGYLQNVKAGNHTVYMVMQAGYAICFAQDRSMIILVNIH
jgi:hypothetical protein